MGELWRDLQENYFTYRGYNYSSIIKLSLVSECVIKNTAIAQYMSLGDLSYLCDHEILMLEVMSTVHSNVYSSFGACS